MTSKLNSDLITSHINLNSYSNKYLINYDDSILKLLGVEKLSNI